MLDFIVGSALLLGGLFVVTWLVSPGLRKRIEAPKYAFLDQTRHFDDEQAATMTDRDGAGHLE